MCASEFSAKVVAVTLNWNNAADTTNCVLSLLEMNYPELRIVVCDNASEPGSWATLLELSHKVPGQVRAFSSPSDALAMVDNLPLVSIIQTGANLGYAGGMNVGLRYALLDRSVEFFWVLNNDTVVERQSLRALVERTKGREDIGICGSSLVLYHDRSRIQAFGGASYNPWLARSRAIGFNALVSDIPDVPELVEKRLAYVIGAAMLVSRRYIEEVGLMDERYFLYSEEHDWAHRGREKFKLGYAPRSIVYHKHGATIGTAASGGSNLSLFYLFRNKLAFTRSHHPALYPSALIALLWDATKLLLRGRPRKARAAFRGILAEPTMRPYEPRQS